MQRLIDNFFSAFEATFPFRTVYTEDVPREMMTSFVDDEGWFNWRTIEGTLQLSQYYSMQLAYGVILPESFVAWHQAYYFLDADLALLRLPHSSPTQPLKAIKDILDGFIPQQLIPQKIYPFGYDGNDSGTLVFDGRVDANDYEFPIRVYDHESGGHLDGLSEVIFSSFPKLLECMTHYMNASKTRKGYEIIPDFFQIDPTGAGTTGVDYWKQWIGNS